MSNLAEYCFSRMDVASYSIACLRVLARQPPRDYPGLPCKGRGSHECHTHRGAFFLNLEIQHKNSLKNCVRPDLVSAHSADLPKETSDTTASFKNAFGKYRVQ